MGKMKTQLYVLSTINAIAPLATILDRIRIAAIQDRSRTVNGTIYRIEEINAPTLDKPYWLFDICKMRTDHGPGIASDLQQTSGIPLVNGQRFSETTAVLYSPHNNHLVIQFNFNGPRASAIANYLSVWANIQGASYEFIPKLNQQTQARINGKTQLTKISFKVAPANISAAFMTQHRSLAQAIHAQQAASGGEFIEVTASITARDRAQTLPRSLLNGVMALLESDVLEKGNVTGRSAPDEKVEAIDLLNEKEELKFNDLPVSNGRVEYIHRWVKLEVSHDTWAGNNII